MFLDILGHRVNTVSFGHGPRTIVGAGGWIGDWELWQQPFEILSQRYRVITYDHVGAGETTVPLDVLTFESLVEMVFGVIDAYEVKRCVLAGESYGATVAIMAALQQPDRFESLVLVDGAPGGFDHSGTRRFVRPSGLTSIAPSRVSSTGSRRSRTWSTFAAGFDTFCIDLNPRRPRASWSACSTST